MVGLREDTLDIPDGGSLGSVFEHYAGRFPRLREMAASTVLALNQQFSSPAAPLAEGDEVALLPPPRRWRKVTKSRCCPRLAVAPATPIRSPIPPGISSR